MQPERFAERLNRLLVLQPDDGSFLATTVRMAAEQHPEVRTRLFREWLRIAPEAMWRFDPARLDDKPVAVAMTVTVNFTLR